MKILDHYIGRAVLGGSLVTTMILLAFFSFATLLTELGDVGRGDYGLPQAILYVLLLLPRLAYQLLPVATMIGTLAGLGVLANNSELTVIRASGVSLARIVRSVLKASLWLMLLAVVLSEYVAPMSEQYAEEVRGQALSGQVVNKTHEGFWTRDGENFISVDAVSATNRLLGIKVYAFDSLRRLKSITYARSAYFEHQSWFLSDIVLTEFKGDQMITTPRDSARWDSLLSPSLLETIDTYPENMTARELREYTRYLRDNGLSTGRYDKAMWGKLTTPLATAVMVLLAIPFVFGSTRSVGMGRRIMVGTLIGIGFYLFDQIFSYMGVVYGFNVVLSAFVPIMIFFVAAMIMLKRVF